MVCADALPTSSLAAWRAGGLLAHQVIVWRKTRPVLGRCDFMWDYEPAMYGWVGGRTPDCPPPDGHAAVWEIA